MTSPDTQPPGSGPLLSMIVAGALGLAFGVLSMLIVMLAVDTPSEREEKLREEVNALQNQFARERARARELGSCNLDLRDECKRLERETESLASKAVKGMGVSRDSVVRNLENRIIGEEMHGSWSWREQPTASNTAFTTTIGMREKAGLGLVLTGTDDDLWEIHLLTFPTGGDDTEALLRVGQLVVAMGQVGEVALPDWPKEELRHLRGMWRVAAKGRGKGYTITRTVGGQRVEVFYIDMSGHACICVTIRPSLEHLTCGAAIADTLD